MAVPYLSSPGNISKAFAAIQMAATPDRVSQDFVKTVLKIPASSGDQMTSFLRRLGFAASDGTPTELYRQYRNTETAGKAMAHAIRSTYGDLSKRNEYFFKLTDDKLKGTIVEATGEATDSRPVTLMLSTLKNLISLADFESHQVINTKLEPDPEPKEHAHTQKMRMDKSESSNPNFGQQIKMNLGYTINLNLPATTDIEVFNAIFKSLREHLLNE